MQRVNTQILVPVHSWTLLLSILFTYFLFMITWQRFIDFLTISSLYFYKNSRRARGCSFYFNFTIKYISTCSPELLLLCFCGLHSIHFLFKKIFALSTFHLLPYSMNFGASLVAPRLKGLPGLDPWVGKIPWRKKWQPTPVFLPGESHGRRSLVGYSPCLSVSWIHSE